jgi:hypothetical protein
MDGRAAVAVVARDLNLNRPSSDGWGGEWEGGGVKGVCIGFNLNLYYLFSARLLYYQLSDFKHLLQLGSADQTRRSKSNVGRH